MLEKENCRYCSVKNIFPFFSKFWSLWSNDLSFVLFTRIQKQKLHDWTFPSKTWKPIKRYRVMYFAISDFTLFKIYALLYSFSFSSYSFLFYDWGGLAGLPFTEKSIIQYFSCRWWRRNYRNSKTTFSNTKKRKTVCKKNWKRKSDKLTVKNWYVC